MAISVPSPLIEFILFGPEDDRRQLQESPILGDVWVAFGSEPDKSLDLLISPFRGAHAGKVAAHIADGLGDDSNEDRGIAFLQGLVAARLTFEELLRVVVPKTKWWIDKWNNSDSAALDESPEPENQTDDQAAPPQPSHALSNYSLKKVVSITDQAVKSAKQWHKREPRFLELDPLERFVALTGLILWAGKFQFARRQRRPKTAGDMISFILKNIHVDEIAVLLDELRDQMLEDETRDYLVYQVSLNRSAAPALRKSIPAVKADAAKTLFSVDCSGIAWAVIDSGIDGAHPAFISTTGERRVKRCFDFKSFRRIVSLSNRNKKVREKNAAFLMEHQQGIVDPPDDPVENLARLAADAEAQGPIHWELVRQFVEIEPSTPPPTNHGTHVAGILGACRRPILDSNESNGDADVDQADGMCPDIQLYDFRVLGPELKDTEFAIIAALQFIRYLNNRDNFLTIHGTNLSLSIPHDVRNYACGRTPVCEECERVVESGVVVVAAAGNHGHKSYQTREGSFESYAAFSITDPGNADSVLTVGSTHRFWPHTYGVSFFSSRGPTGDGRLKPDLVAPGEKIRAPFRKGGWGDLDGTSMAAPHVSGAAAMLMARYSELIGQPRRIKRILCESATDLGRERSFQGHGMLDVLRAFQSI